MLKNIAFISIFFLLTVNFVHARFDEFAATSELIDAEKVELDKQEEIPAGVYPGEARAGMT